MTQTCASRRLATSSSAPTTATRHRIRGGPRPASGGIEGSVVFANYPRRRSDCNKLPNARGLVTTGEGATILFELRGRTIFGDDGVGRQNLVGWFESDHDRYRWLNDVVCIAEGLIAMTACGSTSITVSTTWPDSRTAAA
jgi:hypothetical protein